MEFEKLWEEVWMETKLPNEAKKLLPQSLSKKTKQMILDSEKSTTEIAKLIRAAVDDIDHGSVESVDSLVRKLFEKE